MENLFNLSLFCKRLKCQNLLLPLANSPDTVSVNDFTDFQCSRQVQNEVKVLTEFRAFTCNDLNK